MKIEYRNPGHNTTWMDSGYTSEERLSSLIRDQTSHGRTLMITTDDGAHQWRVGPDLLTVTLQLTDDELHYVRNTPDAAWDSLVRKLRAAVDLPRRKP